MQDAVQKHLLLAPGDNEPPAESSGLATLTQLMVT